MKPCRLVPRLATACLIAAATLAAVAGDEPGGRTSRLQGRAFTGRRDAVVGATVVVRPMDDGSRVFLSSTDEKGVFRIDGLADGSYAVRIEREGFEPAARDEITVRFPFRAVIELPLAPLPRAAPAVAAPAAPTGDASPEPARLEGLVRDAALVPLPEVRVRLVRADGSTDPLTLVSRGDGRFSAAEVAPGDWSIEIRAVGKLPLRTRLALAGAQRLDALLVSQPAGHQPGPLDLMPPEEPVPPAGLGGPA